MRSPLDWALDPLRHYADFFGRSTRTECAFFYILVSILNVALRLATLPLGFDTSNAVVALASLALLCPVLALGARRLHDSGRSGWWLLLGLPTFAGSVWQTYYLVRDPAVLAQAQMNLWPLAVRLPLAICSVALLFLLGWKDDEETNRYGPNPRYGEPAGEPA